MAILSSFQENFAKIVAQVDGLRAAMIPHEQRYNALVARAAGGDNVAEDEWAAIEAEISKITRQVMRCFEILKYQQNEIAKVNAILAAEAAEQIVKTFCFLSPECGHA